MDPVANALAAGLGNTVEHTPDPLDELELLLDEELALLELLLELLLEDELELLDEDELEEEDP